MELAALVPEEVKRGKRKVVTTKPVWWNKSVAVFVHDVQVITLVHRALAPLRDLSLLPTPIEKLVHGQLAVLYVFRNWYRARVERVCEGYASVTLVDVGRFLDKVHVSKLMDIGILSPTIAFSPPVQIRTLNEFHPSRFQMTEPEVLSQRSLKETICKNVWIEEVVPSMYESDVDATCEVQPQLRQQHGCDAVQLTSGDGRSFPECLEALIGYAPTPKKSAGVLLLSSLDLHSSETVYVLRVAGSRVAAQLRRYPIEELLRLECELALAAEFGTLKTLRNPKANDIVAVSWNNKVARGYILNCGISTAEVFLADYGFSITRATGNLWHLPRCHANRLPAYGVQIRHPAAELSADNFCVLLTMIEVDEETRVVSADVSPIEMEDGNSEVIKRSIKYKELQSNVEAQRDLVSELHSKAFCDENEENKENIGSSDGKKTENVPFVGENLRGDAGSFVRPKNCPDDKEPLKMNTAAPLGHTEIHSLREATSKRVKNSGKTENSCHAHIATNSRELISESSTNGLSKIVTIEGMPESNCLPSNGVRRIEEVSTFYGSYYTTTTSNGEHSDVSDELALTDSNSFGALSELCDVPPSLDGTDSDVAPDSEESLPELRKNSSYQSKIGTSDKETEQDVELTQSVQSAYAEENEGAKLAAPTEQEYSAGSQRYVGNTQDLSENISMLAVCGDDSDTMHDLSEDLQDSEVAEQYDYHAAARDKDMADESSMYPSPEAEPTSSSGQSQEFPHFSQGAFLGHKSSEKCLEICFSNVTLAVESVWSEREFIGVDISKREAITERLSKLRVDSLRQIPLSELKMYTKVLVLYADELVRGEIFEIRRNNAAVDLLDSCGFVKTKNLYELPEEFVEIPSAMFNGLLLSPEKALLKGCEILVKTAELRGGYLHITEHALKETAEIASRLNADEQTPPN